VITVNMHTHNKKNLMCTRVSVLLVHKQLQPIRMLLSKLSTTDQLLSLDLISVYTDGIKNNMERCN